LPQVKTDILEPSMLEQARKYGNLNSLMPLLRLLQPIWSMENNMWSWLAEEPNWEPQKGICL